MSRPPNHVPWATLVEVDEMTAHGDFMPPFPSPDDARFLEPPVIEWVPDPAYAAKASPTDSVTPAPLGYTPKSPPGPPPDTIHCSSYAFDSEGMHSPTHSPDEEDPGGGGGLIIDREVPRPSSSAEAAASDNNSGKPSPLSPTGGAAVSLAAEFVLCNDLLEEGEIPEKLVSFLVCRYLPGTWYYFFPVLFSFFFWIYLQTWYQYIFISARSQQSKIKAFVTTYYYCNNRMNVSYQVPGTYSICDTTRTTRYFIRVSLHTRPPDILGQANCPPIPETTTLLAHL